MNSRKMYVALLGILLFLLLFTAIAFAQGEENPDAPELVTWGRYEQDGDYENGPEPIEWFVLTREEDRALLLSRYILSAHDYSDAVDWVKNEFPLVAFTGMERMKILAAKRPAALEHCCFLLSSEEVNQLVPPQIRACAAYGNVDGPNNPWWLDDGVGDSYGNCIQPDGTLSYYNSKKSSCGVRPACWVTLDALDGAEKTPEPYAIPYTQVGSTVCLGHWEQDNVDVNGEEPLEWIVLSCENGQSLLLAKHALTLQRFGEKAWDHSAIRRWLNKDFLESAFSSDEQAAIRIRQLGNPGIPEGSYWSGGGCKETLDTLFLLSQDEVLRYLPQQESRVCTTTEANAADIQFRFSAQEPIPWWTRTSGGLSGVAFLQADGQMGCDLGIADSIFVRPAMWIALNDLTEELVEAAARPLGEDMEAMSEIAAAQALTEAERFGAIGQWVSFGQFEQDGDESNGPEAIDWLVLDTDGQSSLLVSVQGLYSMKYANAIVNPGWGGSDVRRWLAEAFAPQAFTEEEWACVRETVLISPPGPGRGEGVETVDKLFLLSAEEVERLLPQEESRVCTASANAVLLGNLRDNACEWWLRSTPSDPYRGTAVDATGRLLDSRAITEQDVCVRPAMWVDLRTVSALPGYSESARPGGAAALPTRAPEGQATDAFDPYDDY